VGISWRNPFLQESNVCDDLRIQVRLDPDILMNQLDSLRVD